ncbi:MAG: hypothetical protein ACO1OQ_08095, partial [Rufibacter sp.]
RASLPLGSGSGAEAGLLRINFSGYAEDNLEEISWEEFFEKFEEKKLAFLYQDEEDSSFNMMLNRN